MHTGQPKHNCYASQTIGYATHFCSGVFYGRPGEVWLLLPPPSVSVSVSDIGNTSLPV